MNEVVLASLHSVAPGAVVRYVQCLSSQLGFVLDHAALDRVAFSVSELRARCTCAIPHVKSVDIFISGTIFHNKVDQNQCWRCRMASYFERQTLISAFALRPTSNLTRSLNRCQKWMCSKSDSELRGKGQSEIKWDENKITVSSACCCNWMINPCIFILSEKSSDLWPTINMRYFILK